MRAGYPESASKRLRVKRILPKLSLSSSLSSASCPSPSSSTLVHVARRSASMALQYIGRPSLRSIYLGLVITRVCFALFGTGYIHPDEYFQNGEAIAGEKHSMLLGGMKAYIQSGKTLGLNAVQTWEWSSVFPCRSIVPVWLTTGVPFSILRLLHKGEYLLPSSGHYSEANQAIHLRRAWFLPSRGFPS